MSVVLSLTSMAIIACASLTSAAAVAIAQTQVGKVNKEQGFETVFNDSALLLKTLQEHGCCVEQRGENELAVQTACGTLRYFRADASEPFSLYLSEVQQPEALLEEIRQFETEYGRNVQSYTYHHIKDNLPDNMTIVSEEVLDDDALLLTISL